MHIARGRLRGTSRPPTPEEVVRLAAMEHLSLGSDEAELFSESIAAILTMCDRLDELGDPAAGAERSMTRHGGRPPTAEEDPLNAFLWLCEAHGAETGPLAGTRGAVKDNIDLAGVPTSNGSRTTPYLPMRDAVVIERLLGAGARIVGKLNMDDFATGVTGESSSFGTTRNPYDEAHSAGGSSSGAGAAVAAGTIDFSLAVDQGGSARIPASYCGAVTVKPTHGLVPSHGVSHIDNTIDYVCPTAGTVELGARVLDVISGHDDRDGQWVRARPAPTSTLGRLDRGVAGMRIGVVRSAAEPTDCSAGVMNAFEQAKQTLAGAGAELVSVDIDLWQDARRIGYPIYALCMWATTQSDGQGWSHGGEIDVARARLFGLVRRTEADQFPPMLKTMLIFGRFLQEHSLTWYLGRGQNLRTMLRRQIDAALSDCDLLITPTTCHPAPLLATSSMTDVEFVRNTLAGGGENTTPLNLSGHPAVAVPMGLEGALPVSLQIVGRAFDEASALAAARVVEVATPIARPPARPAVLLDSSLL